MQRSYYAATDRPPEFSRDPVVRPFMAKSTAIVFGLLIIAISVTCLVKAIPEYQKLQLVEGELGHMLERERDLVQERRRYELEATALKTNHRYREARARDRLHLYHPGENVIELD